MKILPLSVLVVIGVGIAGCQPQFYSYEEPEPLTITVQGESHIFVEADTFVVNASLNHKDESMDVVLETLSQFNQRMNDHIPRMEGLSEVRLEGGTPRVEAACIEFEVLQVDASRNTRPATQQRCVKQGYVGSVNLRIEGQPATEAGNVVSLALEDGSTEAEVVEFLLRDEDTAMSEARHAAIADAHAKAQDYASAIGGILMQVTKLEPLTAGNYSLRNRVPNTPEDVITVTGSRIEPRYSFSTGIELYPIEDEVVVTYQIEQHVTVITNNRPQGQ